MTAAPMVFIATCLSASSTGPPNLPPRVEQTLATVWNPSASFFPTSRLWWAAHPDGWGFATHTHLVHFNDLAALIMEIRWDGKAVEPAGGMSYPSRAELTGSAPGLKIGETKLLGPEDVLVSLLSFAASAPGNLEIRARTPLGTQGRYHGMSLRFAFAGSGELEGDVRVVRRRMAAGERLEARFALGASVQANDGSDQKLAEAAVAAALAMREPAIGAARDTEAWFARQPLLDVPDPWLETAFLYRIQLARKSIQDPRSGFLRHPSAAEGRWASKWYAAAIPFGAGHQLAELRWLREPEWAWGHLATFVDNQRDDGAFIGARTDYKLGEYSDFVALGAHDLYVSTGDAARFATHAQSLARNVDYTLSKDCDGDFLPEPDDHWQSGMEWQPSYFAFSDYVPERPERLDRVEYACYLFANSLAAARALELAGRPLEARRYHDVANRVAAAIEQKMWDQSARFYRSLRARDDAMAPDREITGFYPPGFGITGVERLGYLSAVSDPRRWASPWPLPSVEMVSPAFAPIAVWPPGKGGSVCMWNGPVWPHALTFVLRSLGRAERAGAIESGSTLDLLASWARAQFLSINGRHLRDFPLAGEFYDPRSGLWQTSERDYFHSAFIDVAITEVMGLRPSEDDIVRFEPSVPRGRWDHFALIRVPYHGHELALAWDEPGGEDFYQDQLEGLTLWIDGEIAATRADLGAIEATLMGRRK